MEDKYIVCLLGFKGAERLIVILSSTSMVILRPGDKYIDRSRKAVSEGAKALTKKVSLNSKKKIIGFRLPKRGFAIINNFPYCSFSARKVKFLLFLLFLMSSGIHP